ncbi:MAG: regulatory protein RecX, partial [Bacilli bacterium]|nr:regulatory protein RecX [Bacilli bacterium]
MKITKIKILKNKVSITLDHKEKLSVDKDVYTNFYLYEGKELDKKEYKSLIETDKSNKLLQYALKIRSKALYSEYQMREKLYKKEASKKDVDYVIKILKSYDLINDTMYALDLVEYYHSQYYGKNKIKQKLSDKGIFDKEIDKIKFSDQKELSKAKHLLPKLEKKYEKYNDSQKKQHIYNA